jgi:nucleoside-diphosphate-sugar epimerase
MTIESVEILEEVMSRPSQADIDAMRALDGDLLILGVGGKMGPSLARRARRAVEQAGVERRVIGVSRFSSGGLRQELDAAGVETIPADLMEENELKALPDVPNVVFMAARKFGTTGAEHLTWAMNTFLPGRVAERFHRSRIVAFSSGNVYPLVPVVEGGATEQTPTVPVGEYAESVLGRERMFQHFSAKYGTLGVLLRLNYAIDLRYGVLLDTGRKVFEGRPVNLAMGSVNVIWQGDANSVVLRSFALASAPPRILNLTGPELLSVRWIALEFGRHFGIQPVFEGVESPTALLNNAAECQKLFGYPTVSVSQLIEWTVEWIRAGGSTLNKPTHFEARDGKF